MEIEIIKRRRGRPIGSKDKVKRAAKSKVTTPMPKAGHIVPIYEQSGRHMLSVPAEIWEDFLQIHDSICKEIGFKVSAGQAIAYLIAFYKRGHQ